MTQRHFKNQLVSPKISSCVVFLPIIRQHLKAFYVQKQTLALYFPGWEEDDFR
jgi:hypothetical protein